MGNLPALMGRSESKHGSHMTVLMQQYSIWGRCSAALSKTWGPFHFQVFCYFCTFETKTDFYITSHKTGVPLFTSTWAKKRVLVYCSQECFVSICATEENNNSQFICKLHLCFIKPQDSAKTKLQWPVVCSIS